MTLEKEFLFDPNFPSELKILQLTDRGRLKYQSEQLLFVVIILWNVFILIESDDNLLTTFVEGSSKKIIVQITLIFQGEVCESVFGDVAVLIVILVDGRSYANLYSLQQIVLLRIKLKIITHF